MIALDEVTGEGIGVARYVRDSEHPDAAEVAVTEMMDVITALGPVQIVDKEAGTVEIEMPIPKLGLSPTLKKLLRISARNDIVVPLAHRH